MESVLKTIKANALFKPGETVGVACSGGADSMALLHYLSANKEKLDINIIAIYIDHNTRELDARDGVFVADYCKRQFIRFQKFKVEGLVIARQRNIGLEQACRDGRYGMFDSLLKRHIVDKIALAHHRNDQGETILLNVLRGSGLRGASGMNYLRDSVYVRPFLDLPKTELVTYCYQNDVPFIEDETNQDNKFARNYLRNVIMPQLRYMWPGVDEALVSFGKVCRTDDEFINKLMNFDAIIKAESMVKIPLGYFVYAPSLVNRMLMDSFQHLKVYQNIEGKHFSMITELAVSGENGARINLPEKVIAYREYDYLTLTRKKVKEKVFVEWQFKLGQTKIEEFGRLKIKLAKPSELAIGKLLVDIDKVPAESVWRLRKDGDYITKFGGGTKKLKSFLIDKRVPARLRDMLPVLAVENEVFAVASVDISDNLKVDEKTKKAATIEYELFE